MDMLNLDLDRLRSDVEACDGFQTQGRLRVIEEGLACALPAALGDQCRILEPSGRAIPAEVIGFRRGLAQLAPYELAAIPSVGQSPSVPGFSDAFSTESDVRSMAAALYSQASVASFEILLHRHSSEVESIVPS